MGGLSLWHWIIVIAVVALLFGGKGKISSVMGDFAKGIKAFKSGMKDEDHDHDADAVVAPPQVTPPVPTPGIAATTTAGDRPAHDRG
jgi:sec-independent protein translocase protein TatA